MKRTAVGRMRQVAGTVLGSAWLVSAAFAAPSPESVGAVPPPKSAGAVPPPEAVGAVPSPEAVGAVVDRAMAEFHVPGMAVTVIHDGETWYARGHGVVETGSRAAVADGTLFQIGSVSKAFTAAALALLVDEGRLRWDAPVIDYLPEFHMYDPWVTREFTVRDLLIHRSGLPLGAGDLLMFPQGRTTRAEVVRALRYLKPASSFRAKFDYDNLL